MIGREGEQWHENGRLARVAVMALAFSCLFGSRVAAQDPGASERALRMEYLKVRRLIDVVLAHPMLEPDGSSWPTDACAERQRRLEELDVRLGVALDGLFRRQRGHDVVLRIPINAKLLYEKEVRALLRLVQERLLSAEQGLDSLDAWIRDSADSEFPSDEAWVRFGLSAWPVLQGALKSVRENEVARRGRVEDRLAALDRAMERVEKGFMQSFDSASLAELSERIEGLRVELDELGARTGKRRKDRRALQVRLYKMSTLVARAAAEIEAFDQYLPGRLAPGSGPAGEGVARDASASDLPTFDEWTNRFRMENPSLKRWTAGALSDLTESAGMARTGYESVRKTAPNRRHGTVVTKAAELGDGFGRTKTRISGQLDGIPKHLRPNNPTLLALLATELGELPVTQYAESWTDRERGSWIEKWAEYHGTPRQMRLVRRQDDGSWLLNGRRTAMILVDEKDHAFLIDRHEMKAREFCERLEWLEDRGPLPRALNRWWTANKSAVKTMPGDRLLSGVPYEVANEFARHAYRWDECATYELALPSRLQFDAAMKFVAKDGHLEPSAYRPGVTDLTPMFEPPTVREGDGAIWGLRGGLAELCGSDTGKVWVKGYSEYRPWTELPGGVDAFRQPGADHSAFFGEDRPRAAHLGAPAIGFRLVFTLERIN